MNDPVAISVVVFFAFAESANNCVLLFFSLGDFQWPNVLCGSSARFAGIAILDPVSESVICIGISGMSRSGEGEPLGVNLNLSTWYEHFGSSNFPPEHHSKSFQA